MRLFPVLVLGLVTLPGVWTWPHAGNRGRAALDLTAGSAVHDSRSRLLTPSGALVTTGVLYCARLRQ